MSAVTGILSFTYFNQATVPSDAELFDRLWQSGYEADRAAAQSIINGSVLFLQSYQRDDEATDGDGY